MMSNFVFEPNKYYKHNSGHLIHCLYFLDTYFFGDHTLIAEDEKGQFIPVGTSDSSYTENYCEISKEEWLKEVSKNN